MTASPVANLNQLGVSAISGSSNLIALRGRRLYLAGSYELDGNWVGTYVDAEELRRVRGKIASDSSRA